MRLWLSAALSGLAATPAVAAELDISVDIPRLTVAEYHRPYVAIWLERPDQSVAANLAVWYDLALKDDEGTKWLKDMRQWWRRIGRELDMPVDGISGATRAPGTHALSADTKILADLPAGEYRLVVEAAREVGGRELLRLPFNWPPQAPTTVDAQGEHELGAVTLALKPDP